GRGVCLHSARRTGVTLRYCPIDNIEALRTFVQPYLVVRCPTAREVRSSPLDVEDAVGCASRYRGEYTGTGAICPLVIPVREDGVVCCCVGQAAVRVIRVRCSEVQLAVRCYICRCVVDVVQPIRERQVDRGRAVVAMVARVSSASHDSRCACCCHVVARGW